MRRLLEPIVKLVLLLFIISLLLFLAFRFLPGDPARAMLGLSASPERVESLREEMGLNDPLAKQYLRSLTGLFSDTDPLRSFRFKKPVSSLIADRLPLSAGLTVYSFVLILVLSIPLALVAAYRPEKPLDFGVSFLTRILQSIPPFFLAMLLTIVSAMVFGIFQKSFYPHNGSFFTKLKALTLPALSIALPRLSQAFQFLRDALVDEWKKDYVWTARSQGAHRPRILLKQLLPNALVPFITATGLILVELLTASLIVEQVFKLPGLGQLLFTAVSQRDFPLAQTLLLFFAFWIIVLNRLVDVLNRVVDPRLFRSKRGRKSRRKEAADD